MDVRRHTTAGRLSELFGEQTLQVDKTIRTMGWRRVAEQELSRLSPETQAYLQAYSDGVNAYLHDHTPSEMSLEYTLLARNGLDYRSRTGRRPTPCPGSRRWRGTCAATWRTRYRAPDVRAPGPPDEIAQLFPPYPYGRHRRDRGPGRGRRRRLRANI